MLPNASGCPPPALVGTHALSRSGSASRTKGRKDRLSYEHVTPTQRTAPGSLTRASPLRQPAACIQSIRSQSNPFTEQSVHR
ncbi:MAG: hypothetical protein OXC07_03200, partial [Kistimonas sp.]|nr:hypothetical protein [Kistimonas sp.]